NNTIYLRWITNSLGMEWFEKYTPTSFTVAYEKEMYLHQEGAVHSDISTVSEDLKSGDTFNSQHVIDSEDKAHCLTEITWQVK
ncbi:acyl-ACP thioesterase, partial [Streptococcus pneumoniae]